MPYTPTNNPYAIGDPYMYDLRWIVNKVKYVDKEIDDFVAYNKLHFEGNWNGNKTYAAWSIVEDVNGDGYLAIKAVPRNVTLDNTEYWALVANYSALFAAYEQRISDLESATADLENDVAELQRQILDDTYLFISDSYGTDDPDGDRLSWITHLINILDLTLNVNAFRYHKAGAGFAHNNGQPGSVEGKNFCDVLNSAVAGMSATNRNKVTKIIIGGGVNDWDGTDVDTQTGIENFDAIARANFPNAEIMLVACGWAKRADIRYATVARYKVYYDVGNYLGWAVDNKAYQAIQDKRLFVADGVHPTIAGGLMIAREINDMLKGVSLPANDTAPVAVMINGTQRGRAYISNNSVVINIGSFSPNALPDLGANATIDACTIDCPYIFGGGTVSEEFIISLNMKISGVWKSKLASGFFRYDAGTDTTYFCIHNNAEFDGSNYGSYSGIADSYVTIGKVVLAPYC